MFELFKKSYSGLSRDTWILAVITLINRTGMMVLPFMAVYLHTEKNFTYAETGIISSFFGLGSMCGSYAGGQLSDRFGYFPVQLLSLILGGISCVLLGWIDGFLPLCAGMFVTSMLLDMLRPAMSSAVAASASQENITRSFSLIRMAINLGAGIGPIIAGFIASISFKLIFICDGLTSVAAGIFTYYFFKHKIRKSSLTKKSIQLSDSPLKNTNYLWYMILCMSYATIFFQLFSTLPLYYENVYNWSTKEIGLLIALNGIIVCVFEMMLVFKLEKTVHPGKIIIFGVLLSAVGLVMLNFFGGTVTLIISMIILSFSEIFAMPFMMSVAVSQADDTNRGRYTGMYSVAWSAAFILSPLIGTTIVTHWGFETLWWTMGGMAILTMAGMRVVVKKLTSARQTIAS